MAEASTVAARCAAYATALTDLLVHADELGVTEDDRCAIRKILLLITSHSYSEALRAQLRATHNRRLVALKALDLPREFHSQAVIRVPREGPYVFGGSFLQAVDSDISMNKRAQEVAQRVKPRLQTFRRPSRGGGYRSSVPVRGSYRGKPRSRNFTRRGSTRNKGAPQPTGSGSATPFSSAGDVYRK